MVRLVGVRPLRFCEAERATSCIDPLFFFRSVVRDKKASIFIQVYDSRDGEIGSCSISVKSGKDLSSSLQLKDPEKKKIGSTIDVSCTWPNEDSFDSYMELKACQPSI